MSSATVTSLVYGVYKSAFSRDPNPFKIVWRQPQAGGGTFGRVLGQLAYPTERIANQEAARLNSLVSDCATEGCKGTVYPHEAEAREYSETGDVCERCFNKKFDEQLGLEAAASR